MSWHLALGILLSYCWLILFEVSLYVQASIHLLAQLCSCMFCNLHVVICSEICSHDLWFICIYIYIIFLKYVNMELVHRPKSCCVSSIMQVSPLVHGFWKLPFQRSWQNGLSEALKRFQYLFVWNKNIKSSWE